MAPECDVECVTTTLDMLVKYFCDHSKKSPGEILNQRIWRLIHSNFSAPTYFDDGF